MTSQNVTLAAGDTARPAAPPPQSGQTLVAAGGVRAMPSPVTGATLAAGADLAPPSDPNAPALSETVAAGPADLSMSTRKGGPSLAAATYTRAAVLPRTLSSGANGEVEIGVDGRARFERVKRLGEGGVGEVLLAQDHDINRKVALKRLRSDQRNASSLLRFAEEARVIGQLEHPGIVPVHDVGIDEDGQHYLVMKYVQGDTLETVIEKLRAHDPEYTARFTPEYRAHVFLEILDAVRYAHARGIIHRDIKPANIMVGPYGEVTVMDWGLAKKVGTKDAPAAEGADAVNDDSPGETQGNGGGDPRLLRTRQGALLGTPLYMSPEQARGRNDELDVRSDVWSLSMLWLEFQALWHPYAKCQTVQHVLLELVSDDPTLDLMDLYKAQMKASTPCEYLRWIRRGLEKDPAKRFQSVDEMADGLRRILSGKIQIDCHVTLAKRSADEVKHWIDRNPNVFTAFFVMAVLGTLTALGWGGYRAVMALAHLTG